MQHNEPGFLSFILACLSGGFVSAIRIKDGSVAERVVTGSIGFLVAFHIGPVIHSVLGLNSDYIASVGFVVGMVGKEMATAIIDTARDHGPEYIKRIFHRKGD